LEFDERKAYVHKVDVDYFTQAIRYTEVKTLEVAAESGVPGPAVRVHGDVLVRSQVVGFKKIKFFTLENVGSGNLELPENEMHTTAYWIKIGRALLASLPYSISERQDGLFGLLYALESMATLLLMCDKMDLGSTIGEGLITDPGPVTPAGAGGIVAAGETRELFEPSLYLYDAYPGGMGMSEPLFRIHDQLVNRTRELIAGCGCERGCPSCVGPVGETGPHAREAALAILRFLCGD
jgi:DEAD/DEAH box helicase domain-containing protein